LAHHFGGEAGDGRGDDAGCFHVADRGASSVRADSPAFTVYYSPSGDEVFPEGSTFKVQDNGVLTTTTTEGRRRINSPNAWHHVEVQASPPRPKQAAKTVVSEK